MKLLIIILFFCFKTYAVDSGFNDWLLESSKKYKDQVEEHLDKLKVSSYDSEWYWQAYKKALSLQKEKIITQETLNSCYSAAGFLCPYKGIERLNDYLMKIEMSLFVLNINYPLLDFSETLNIEKASFAKLEFVLNRNFESLTESYQIKVHKLDHFILQLEALQTTKGLGSNQKRRMATLKRIALKSLLYQNLNILKEIHLFMKVDKENTKNIDILGFKIQTLLQVNESNERIQSTLLFSLPFILGPVGLALRFLNLKKLHQLKGFLNTHSSKNKFIDELENSDEIKDLIENSRNVIRAVNQRDKILKRIDNLGPTN